MFFINAAARIRVISNIKNVVNSKVYEITEQSLKKSYSRPSLETPPQKKKRKRIAVLLLIREMLLVQPFLHNSVALMSQFYVLLDFENGRAFVVKQSAILFLRRKIRLLRVFF